MLEVCQNSNKYAEDSHLAEKLSIGFASLISHDAKDNGLQYSPLPNGNCIAAKGVCNLPSIRRATVKLFKLQDFLGIADAYPDVTSKLITCCTWNKSNDVERHLISSSGSDCWWQSSKINKKDLIDIKQEASSIILDVLHLIGRLETERINTVASLAEERQKVELLRKRIDHYAFVRLKHLPYAVQSEHELCANNIQELKWHLTLSERSMYRANSKTAQLRKQYSIISREMAIVESDKPLIGEKVKMLYEEMAEIQKQQDSTDKKLTNALAVLATTQSAYDKTVKRSDEHTSVLNAEINVVKDQLTTRITELTDCEADFVRHCNHLEELNCQIETCKEEIKALESNLKDSQTVNHEYESQHCDLNERILEQDDECQHLIDDNNQLRSEKEAYENMLESQNSKLQQKIKRQQTDLRALIGHNRDTERDLRILQKDIEKCGKQMVSDEKAMKRASAETEKISKEFEICMEETARVHLINETLKATLQKERVNAACVEEELKTTSEALNEEAKEESQARIVLQARIAADSKDLERITVESKTKWEKVESQQGNSETVVSNIHEQLSILEATHNDRQKAIDTMDNILEKIITQQAKLESEMTMKFSNMEGDNNQHKNDLSVLNDELKEMIWQTDAMDSKLSTMVSSSVVMNRTMQTTQHTLIEMSKDIDELRLQLTANRGTVLRLTNSVEACQERHNHAISSHEMLVSSRQSASDKAMEALHTSLSENDQLSKRYLQLQTDLINEKDGLLKMMEVSDISQFNRKDQFQLREMHKQLHRALESYYKLRGLQLRKGISQFIKETNENGDKITMITEDLEHLIHHISMFLVSSEVGEKRSRK